MASRRRGAIGSATLAGTSIAFVGVFVFVDTARHGAGYVLTTIGLAIIGTALLATLCYGSLAGQSTTAECGVTSS